MKNTVITARRKKIELLTLLACFIIGNLANLYAIISYEIPLNTVNEGRSIHSSTHSISIRIVNVFL